MWEELYQRWKQQQCVRLSERWERRQCDCRSTKDRRDLNEFPP